MKEEIMEYQKYLLNFGVVEKPIMPNFNVFAYTDNEYLSDIYKINEEYDQIDDFYLTLRHLRGE